MSISDYLHRVKNLADSLVAAGLQVGDDNDMLLYILGGLGNEHENFVTAIMTRLDPISVEDLHSLLRNHELHLSRVHAPLEPNSITLLTTNSFGGSKASFKSESGPASRGSSNSQQGGGRGRGRSFGGRRGDSQHSGGRFVCRICNIRGHSALDCYNRLNLSYQGPTALKATSCQ